jgi:hypothetical protein
MKGKNLCECDYGIRGTFLGRAHQQKIFKQVKTDYPIVLGSVFKFLLIVSGNVACYNLYAHDKVYVSLLLLIIRERYFKIAQNKAELITIAP